MTSQQKQSCPPVTRETNTCFYTLLRLDQVYSLGTAKLASSGKDS